MVWGVLYADPVPHTPTLSAEDDLKSGMYFYGTEIFPAFSKYV